jgi:MFS family permease
VRPRTVDRPAPSATPTPLLAVFVATFFVRFAFGLTLAIFASYIAGHSTGLSVGEADTAGWVSALAPVGEFSTVVFCGIAADRFGRFRVLFFGMAAASALLVFVSTTRDLAALGATNLAFGVASGAILAASLAVVAEFSGTTERGFEMGRFDAMNLFGWVAGFAFGLGLEDMVPNRSLSFVFLTGAAALAVGLAAAGWLARSIRRARPVAGFSPRSVLRNAFRLPVLVVTLPWLVIYALIGTALVFIGPSASAIGIRPGYLALVIAGGGALLVVTQPYFGRLADRQGRTRMMTVGALGFGLAMLFSCLLVAYGFLWPLGLGLGVSVLLALAYGPAALAALADLAREISRATTMAIYSLTISFGMTVGLLASTTLLTTFGAFGLYVYFGGLAAVLGALTGARWREVARATIPVR